jgi:hypothetical protein
MRQGSPGMAGYTGAVKAAATNMARMIYLKDSNNNN